MLDPVNGQSKATQLQSQSSSVRNLAKALPGGKVQISGGVADSLLPMRGLDGATKPSQIKQRQVTEIKPKDIPETTDQVYVPQSQIISAHSSPKATDEGKSNSRCLLVACAVFAVVVGMAAFKFGELHLMMGLRR